MTADLHSSSNHHHTNARGRTLTKVSVLALGLAAGAGTAAANIIATSGDVVLIAPPASVVLGATQSDTELFAFNERQCIKLAADLHTDQGAIAKGTRISSHFLHHDAVTTSVLGGRARLDANIIGVISTTALLDASDGPCGLPSVTYPTGAEVNRGLEASQPNDGYTIVGPRTIQLQMDVPSFSDQVRVITECAGTSGGQPD